MAASNNGRTDAVIQLLQDGADPNMQDHVGTILIHFLLLLYTLLRLVGQLCCQR